MARLQLHDLLKVAAGDDGKVYFQPPDSLKMVYPCIRYMLDAENVIHADNTPHRLIPRYQATVIDHDPDSVIRDRVRELPMTSFERFYTKDNLNHFVYNIFFD